MSNDSVRGESTGPALGTLRHMVSFTLLGGLLASGTLLLIGLIMVLWGDVLRPSGEPPSIFITVRHAFAGDPVQFLNSGLLVLMCTPLFRVAVLAVGWSWERDYRMSFIALMVLTLLILSAMIGSG